MITIGQATFDSAAEVWNTFTAYQTVDEFLAYGQPGQSVAAQVAAYVAELSDPVAPSEQWRDFIDAANRDITRDGSGRHAHEYDQVPGDERVSSAEAARIVARAMTDYAESVARPSAT